MYYCSFCLIVRDDHNYIREWLDYHLALGVEHFYITDNNSNPPLESTIKDYIEKGFVTYKYDTRFKPQIAVYNECIRNHREHAKWIGFFDSDEFLLLKRDTNIKTFLKNYEDFGALSICWYLFGSNGHLNKQTSVLNSYTKRSANTNHYKTIVQPKAVHLYEIHNVKSHNKGYYTVDERKRKISGPHPRSPSTELCQLNHYVVRSRADFADKMKRAGGNNPNPKTWDFFNAVEKGSTIDDTLIIESYRRLKSPASISQPVQTEQQPEQSVHQEQQPEPQLVQPLQQPEQKSKSNIVRLIPKDFDWEAYLINNPDAISQNKVCNRHVAIRHWITKGIHENRSYTRRVPFNWRKYVERYPDLQRHGIMNQEKAIAHYINNGRNEGRNPY